MIDPKSAPQPPSTVEDKPSAWPYTRLMSILVLIPSLPMLLLSVIALGLFYVAPTRFGNLIARLPGEAFIRSALVFAPVTLFAVVVLAFLYALERPPPSAVRVRAQLDQESEPHALDALTPWLYVRTAARVVLAPAVLGLLVASAVWALSFVSPSRFDRLMTPLPGDRYLRPLVPWAPVAMFVIVLVVMYLSMEVTPRGRVAIRTDRSVNLAVLIAMVSAIPILLVSLAALGLSYFSPARFERLLAKLPYESFIRLVLSFAPMVLFAIVALAILYFRKQTPIRMQLKSTAASVRSTIDVTHIRSAVALWVLVGGLILSAAVGLGLLSVVIYLVLR